MNSLGNWSTNYNGSVESVCTLIRGLYFITRVSVTLSRENVVKKRDGGGIETFVQKRQLTPYVAMSTVGRNDSSQKRATWFELRKSGTSFTSRRRHEENGHKT